MRAGRLRHRLILQKKVATTSPETKNAYGERTDAWVTQATVWGAIEPISGKEYLGVQQTQNPAVVRVVMRYYANLDESWRIVNDSRAFAIEYIRNENDRNRMFEVFCSQGVREADDLPSLTAQLSDVAGNLLTFVDGEPWESVA